MEFEAYNIGGNNFFKLRDLAYAISGTEKQFDIGWDNDTRAITLVTGVAYTVIGQEMLPGDGLPKSAHRNTNINISLDGAPVDVTAYLIGGNNFVRLRDVMQLVDVSVEFDPVTRNIMIDTSLPYSD